MRLQISQQIQLVITVALKKEIPWDWLESLGIPVMTLKALKSGALDPQRLHQAGILAVITGHGLQAARDAASWIRDKLNPIFAVKDSGFPLGRWICPERSFDEAGNFFELDVRVPFPHHERIRDVKSLLSVRRAVLNCIPEEWKEHDAVDMECSAQAEVFKGTHTHFHCLKFGTDYSDTMAVEDFNRNLELFKEGIKKLLDFAAGLNRRKISIAAVVPVYNRGHTVRRAIDSVLSQSHVPDEIIVVDDGSTDGTKETLKGYGDDITILSLNKNSGPSRARNEGIHTAGSEWIAFLDSDDRWEKDKIKKQVAYLRKYPFYEIMQTEEIWIRRGVRVNPCRHHEKPAGWIFEQSLQRCVISPSSVLIRKSLLERYGNFDETFPVCEDYDLWLRITRNHPVGLDPAHLVTKYGGHKDQLSQRYPVMDRFRVTSLYKMLKRERSRHFREKIIPVLEQKLGILIRGYQKRGRQKEAEECRHILSSLDEFL
jgi:glycosyltransferase involved in cell wall biosynthesis